MSRYAAFVLLFSSGIVFQLSRGIEVNVTDKGGKLCLYANLTINFSVSYDVGIGKGKHNTFMLPENATNVGSKCDNTSSILKLLFGAGNSWTVNFTLTGKNYQADAITFAYNLSDSVYFPGSSSNGTESVTVKSQITDVGLNTCYSCQSEDLIQHDLVNMTLSNVLIQAFVSNGSRSENITSCRADVPTTTVSPTTHVTNSTPTSTPTPPPTTTPTPTLPTPTTGKYNIKDANDTVCLLANLGLRIGFRQGQKYQEMNLEPNRTQFSGSCGTNVTELMLVSSDLNITFIFLSDTKKFSLHVFNVTVHDASFSNTNLSLWQAAVGSSYMCNKEQNYTIANNLSLYTFNLQVQPFNVQKGVFSTAEECFLDSDLSFLVPIAVGVALSFLIILVLISYLIGRRKSRTGYQSV